MKKTLFLVVVLFLGWGITFAAPSPELLESLTTQILEQQTKTKSAKEVLDQLKPLFLHCAKSHKDKTIQEICKVFTSKYLPILEKKWENVEAGGVAITHLGRLSNKERFGYFWLDNIANYSLQKPSASPNEFEYAVLNFPEFALSFFIPTLSEKNIPWEDNGIVSECENFKKIWKKDIDTLKQEFPNHIGQIMDQEEWLHNTICIPWFSIKRYPKKTKDVFTTSTFDTTWNQIRVTISPNQFKKGETLESIAEKKCLNWKTTIASDIYFNTTWAAYYPLDSEWVRLDSWESFSWLSIGAVWDTSNLIKKTLGVGKNLQRMIENWEAKVLACRWSVYLQLTNTPQWYYKFSFTHPSFLLGYYVGFDLNNPDGTSSFLTQ